MESAVDRVETGQDDHGEDGGLSSISRARLLSPRLAGIVYLRQISAKMVNILSTTAGLLDDLDNVNLKSSARLCFFIKSEEDSRYQGWLSEMQDMIDDDDESLHLSGSLMGWKEGVLVVNFSDTLVQFLREVRQLDEMGFDIPRTSGRKGARGVEEEEVRGDRVKIADKAFEAEKYYRYGILLKKLPTSTTLLADD